MTHAPAGQGKSIRNAVGSFDRDESAASMLLTLKQMDSMLAEKKTRSPEHDFGTVPEQEGIWRER